MKKVFLALTLLFGFSFSQGPVSYYGKLKVREGRPFIDGIKGDDTTKLVQIRGVSFGWSTTNWESSRFYNANAVERIAKDWKAEVVRAAYGATGLAFSSADAIANRNRIETIVDAAIENDIYVIIDWHSHNAQNEKAQATEFFAYMAEKYGKSDNVIFELYNEPICSTGGNSCQAAGRTTWAEIKDYAEEIIPIIREHSDNLILVGTPEWSQRVESVIGKGINDPNVGYVLHFYAASHPVSTWKANMDAVISSGLPVFVTEYGTTHSDGGCSPVVAYRETDCPTDHYNSHNATSSNEWHSYMDSKKISSVAWNINDKYEGSAFFGTVATQGGGTFDQSPPENWADTTKMTSSGKYIFKKLNSEYLKAPWNLTPILPYSSQSILPGPNTIVEVYSLQGKKLGKDVSNLKNGVYIFLLRENGLVQTKILRIVK